MLLKTYEKEIFRPKCNPSFQSLHCIAHLEEDIHEVLPYLNTVLGGETYTKDPPSVTFKAHGKLITVHSEKIAINALRDEQEADTIIKWLKREINEAWEGRAEIKPSFHGASHSRPQILEILKLLPKTNCGDCAQKTCMVFASLVADGAKGSENCPSINKDSKAGLDEYLSGFKMDA